MILIFFFVSILLSCLPLLQSSATDGNISMAHCPGSFSCRGLGAFKYPFYNVTDTRCGLIKVTCTSKDGDIRIGGRSYEITGKYNFEHNSSDWSYNIVISNKTLEHLVQTNSCEAIMNNFSFSSPSPLLYSIIIRPFITLFKCTKNLTYFRPHKYNSYNGCKDHHFYYNYFNGSIPSDLPHTCQVLHLPVKLSSMPGLDETNIFSLISFNPSIFFQLSPSCVNCYKKGRWCDTKNEHDVECSDAIKDKPSGEPTPSADLENQDRKLTLIKILVITGLPSIVMLSFAIFIMWRHCKSNPFSYVSSKNKSPNLKVEMFLKNHKFLAPKRYSYSQVEKMTNSFKVKLGQGGFGAVYKGVLKTQDLVAVKVLSEVKGDGEDFINEVASVGRTSHVNVVSLLGFCLEGRRKALIYEFMPKGSLERFIYSRGPSSTSQLGWEKLHQIAVGIARGLDYLYRGCSTRILHFDIKPHNILLDNDFCPKISDFGLAKLFHEKESKISISHTRGTPGYIAPELFSRNFGEVSHKSDVYSYGMMILEMVGGRQNIEVGVDHTSEIYFPHWIYKKIELHEEQLGLHEIVTDEDNKIARKMIIVGLWCIQTNPLSRPTITKVLEMLEGDLKSLELPPKPYLSSPPRYVGSPSTDSMHPCCSST